MGESSSPPVPRGDAELIGAIASGDEAAYATLRERHEAAARSLARQFVQDPAEADEVVSETFTRLHAVLRRGSGPEAAVRPYLLTAVRRVADERSGGGSEGTAAGERPGQRGDAAAGRPESPGLGEPLPGDPAASEPESEPLARAFLSLPERWRAVLWHTEIEQADPGQAAAWLGLTADGLAELGEQARAGLSRAYLKLYLAGLTREDCRSAAGKLDLHLIGAARGHNEGKVQRHLRACRACRAVAVELAGLGRSLRGAVAPVFLGPAAAAYLAAAKAAPGRRAGAPAGSSPGTTAGSSPGTTARAPAGARVASGPRGTRQAARQPRAALVAGVVVVAALALTGLTLTLAASTAPPRSELHPDAAAAAPPRPAATMPLPFPSSAPGRSQPAAPARPVTPTVPASPSRLDPDAAASPSPSPFFDRRRHRHHHRDPGQPSVP
jgi:DNA-directed RNA polymerase specialized sigma24 family protein